MNVPHFVHFSSFQCVTWMCISFLLQNKKMFQEVNCVYGTWKLAVGICFFQQKKKVSCRHLFILYMSLARYLVSRRHLVVFSNCMPVNKNVFLQAEHFIPDRRPDKRWWCARSGPDLFPESSVIWSEASEFSCTPTMSHPLPNSDVQSKLRSRTSGNVLICDPYLQNLACLKTKQVDKHNEMYCIVLIV